MFNKKVLLAALLLAGTAGGLVSCNEKEVDEFEQNTEDFVAPEETMYIIGSHWNSWGTDTIADANPSCKFTRSTTDSNIYEYTAVVTQEMVDAWCGFKFIASNSWSVQFGMEDVNFEASNDAFKNLYKNEDGSVKVKTDWAEGTTNRSNVEAKLPGTYHITYNPFDFSAETTDKTTYSNKFTVTFTPAA